MKWPLRSSWRAGRRGISAAVFAALVVCALGGCNISILTNTFDTLSGLQEAEGLLRDARYQEAEAEAMRALRSSDRLPRAVKLKIAPTALNILALAQYEQGRLDEAESSFRRALKLAPPTPGVAKGVSGRILVNLGKVLDQRGLDQEAERHYQQGLEMLERTSSPEDPNWALALLHLGRVSDDRGRQREAVDLLKRGIRILEDDPADAPRALAAAYDLLGGVYFELNEFDLAQQYLERSAGIARTYLRPDDPFMASYYSHSGELALAQGRLDEAERFFQRGLELNEAKPTSVSASVSLAFGHRNLGSLRMAQQRYEESERYLERALAVMDELLGPKHPDAASAVADLAAVQIRLGNVNGALQNIDRFAQIFRQRWRWTPKDRSLGVPADHNRVRKRFLSFLDVLAGVLDEGRVERVQPLQEQAFEAIQLVTASRAAAALLRMSARLSADSDALGRKIRERQEAVVRWRRHYRRLTSALAGERTGQNEQPPAAWHTALAELDSRIERLDAEIAAEFPQYAELLDPTPSRLDGIRKLLAPDEALVAYAFGEDQSFVMLVRRDAVAFRRLGIDARDLYLSVNRIRFALALPPNRRAPDPFDSDAAFELYQRLFGPIEDLLGGVKHLIVVPDRSLTSLPLGLLITQRPVGRPTSDEDYRQVPWLFRRYAVSVLPAVSSLPALRDRPPRARAASAFIGFGDPRLEARAQRGTKPKSGRPGATKDRYAWLRHFRDLPQTQSELQAVAKALGAGASSVVVGDSATESAVMRRPLDDFRVVMFATHGVTPDTGFGPPEAGLILTPPAQRSELDDGFLRASEVARLKLNADLAILSACSTAYAQETNTVGFTNLVSAFFFAGARAIVVSHWVVEADSSGRLTARLAETLAGNPGMRAAEALRQAMEAVMTDPYHPEWAHPVYWAPFTISGESPGAFRAGGQPGG